MAAFNLIMAGVGGQGNLVATRAVAEAAIDSGLRPTLGETYGASRRGGSVFTHLRLTPDSESDPGPLVPRGQADAIIGLEPMESLRAAVVFGSKRTNAIVSTMPIETLETLSGKTRYPPVPELVGSLSRICGTVWSVDPRSLEADGRIAALNVWMLGVLCETVDLPVTTESVRKSVATLSGSADTNVETFDLGVLFGQRLAKK